ncbi:MAG: DUF1800 domain-containing protein [Terriglobales bacterium]
MKRLLLIMTLAGLAVAASPQLSAPQAQIVAALNRLTWGIEPGQVKAVEKIGLNRWIDQQLHPEDIAENLELNVRLQQLATLHETPAQIIANYPPPQALRQMARGKRPLPRDPLLREIVQREISDRQPKRTGKPVTAVPAGMLLSPPAPRLQAQEYRALPADARQQEALIMPAGMANRIAPWLPLGEARQLIYDQRPQLVPAFDLTSGKILRAVYSTRQLQDVLTDFWFNHFNVFIRKGDESDLIASFVRDAIRPHVLGKFRDLLVAAAETPAMMFYLDNWQSVDPAVNKRGINENYGRELMELQTLGVNGGYTQQDVIAVAHCFTGWTIRQPGRLAEFYYNDRLHDPGPKLVLRVKIPAGGGMSDGLKVLDMLARSPATAHHVSFELAQRFVADDPPPALVEGMTQTWLHSDGDLRQVMETMLQAPEFWQAASQRSKIKSPLQLVVSSVRALDAEVTNPVALSREIAAMGEPLYAKEPPTGYTNNSAQWVSTSGLIARMQFATRLAANQVPGVQVELTTLGSAAEFTQALLHQVPAQAEQSGLEDAKNREQLAALILGSPEFQKR